MMAKSREIRHYIPKKFSLFEKRVRRNMGFP